MQMCQDASLNKDKVCKLSAASTRPVNGVRPGDEHPSSYSARGSRATRGHFPIAASACRLISAPWASTKVFTSSTFMQIAYDFRSYLRISPFRSLLCLHTCHFVLNLRSLMLRGIKLILLITQRFKCANFRLKPIMHVFIRLHST